MAADESFAQRCVDAAQADVARCWEDYIALVGRRSTGDPRDAGGGAGEDLRNARAALITALAIERAALDEVVDDEVAALRVLDGTREKADA